VDPINRELQVGSYVLYGNFCDIVRSGSPFYIITYKKRSYEKTQKTHPCDRSCLFCSWSD